MAAVARIGDITSHGGTLAPPVSTDVLTNGRGTAFIGTTVYCPTGFPFPHGPTKVITGKMDVLVNGKPCAHVGSLTSCTAVVVTGSNDTEV